MTERATPPADWFRLAERSIGLSEPNPRVACWLQTRDGRRFQGFTQRAGQAHAEVHAIGQARAVGADLTGATAYVTLEPCSHHGRTPPCCDALIQAGVARVHVAMRDPNPLVAGRGLQRLREAGIDVVEADPNAPERAHAQALNIGFLSRMARALPWVRLKVAASLDGITALPDGQSQWITDRAAREDGHRWRHRAGAVLTGIGTVRDDNPRLDVRLPDAQHQPPLVIVDSRLQTPPSARLFEPPVRGGPRPIWIYHAVDAPAQAAALRARGAETIALPGPGDKVDLPALMRDLARRDVNELHVEAGAKLNASLVREGLVDELLVYLAPRLLGQGAGMVPAGPYQRIADAPSLHWIDNTPIGPDLRLRAVLAQRDAFLAGL